MVVVLCRNAKPTSFLSSPRARCGVHHDITADCMAPESWCCFPTNELTIGDAGSQDTFEALVTEWIEIAKGARGLLL